MFCCSVTFLLQDKKTKVTRSLKMTEICFQKHRLMEAEKVESTVLCLGGAGSQGVLERKGKEA